METYEILLTWITLLKFFTLLPIYYLIAMMLNERKEVNND